MSTYTATAYDVVIKPVGVIRVASIRSTVPDIDQIGDTFDRLFGTLENYILHNGRATGPHMAIYHDTGTGPDMLNMSVELALPFEGAAVDDDQVRIHNLSPVENMACTIHRGLFEEIGRAYEALFTWVRDNGYTVAGPTREIYMNCGKGDGPDYVTELQVPVTK